jgi:anaerobic ribonucleoside-triphosphate reductase
MLTIIKCLDCGITMAYTCETAPWKCAKCGKQRPKVLPMAHRQALKIKRAPEAKPCVK